MTLRSTFNPTLGILEVHSGNPTIPAGQFERREDIQTVLFSDDLVSIEPNSFAYCSNLIRIDWSESLLSIGKESFIAGFSLQTLVFPDSLVSIGDYAFQYARSLRSVELGNNVTTIGKRAFSNASVLNELTLGDALVSIGEKAFYNSPELREVNIPDSVLRIGDEAFAGTGISAVELPNHFSENPPIEAFEPGTVFSFRNELVGDAGTLTGEGWQSPQLEGFWSDEADVLDATQTTPTISWTIAHDQTVNTGKGRDQLIFHSQGQAALRIAGRLNMQNGKDLLRLSIEDTDAAVINDGTIHMGKGRDQIDLVTGTTIGSGTIKLGPGNDIVSGFGQQRMLNGGKGDDRMLLPPGRFEILQQDKGLRITQEGIDLTLRSIEWIGGRGTEPSEQLQMAELELPTTLIIETDKVQMG